jgi:hypothetical protein
MRNDTRHVFIVGCPRSGTTVLHSVLGRHPEVFALPETHFYHFALKRNWLHRFLAERSQLGNYRQFADWMAHNYPDIALPSMKLPRALLVTKFHRVCDEVARHENASCWVEKTPDNLHHLDHIASLDPIAKFIHIVRDPVAVIASLLHVTRVYPETWRFDSVEKCIKKWTSSAELTLTAASKLDNNIVILYDKLLSSEEKIKRKCWSFMGLQIPDELDTKTPDIVYENEAWKKDAATSVLKNPENRAEALLDPDEIHEIHRATEGLYKKVLAFCDRDSEGNVQGSLNSLDSTKHG